MALPQQIRDAEAAADALLAQANTPQEAPAEASTPTESPVEADAPASAEAAPEPTPAPAADPFEARYKVLQGKYNAEVPQLHRKVHELEDQLQRAIRAMEEANRAKEQPQQQVPQADPKDVENFGSDLVEMVNRVSSAQMARLTQVLDGKLATFGQQIAKLYEQIGGTTQHVAQTAEQMFFDKLEKLVPDWEAINADQRFLNWLAETDPVYGLPRQAALKRAQETLDASRAAAVFTAFTGPRQQAPKPNSLDKQVSPRGTASAAPAPSQKKAVSSADITKFYDDVRRGAYRGREQLAAQMEQEFNLALAEGRVR